MCATTYFSTTHHIGYEKSIQKTFEHLSTDCDILVPLENSTAGYVYQTLDGFISQGGLILSTYTIPIQFACVGNLSNAQKIYAQFVTQQQCQQFLSSHPELEIITTSSNSESFNYIQEGSVAIVPMHLVDKDHPHIDHIEDYSYNETRFAHVGLDSRPSEYHKASLIITPHIDKPGLLYEILGKFKMHQINLTAILSRPNKKIEKKYHFYIEVDVKLSSENAMNQILEEMDDTFDVKYLGHY